MKRIGIIVGAIFLVLGIGALSYGGFDYTEDHTALKMGPLQVDVEQDKRVNVPVWAGVALTAVGGVLLLVGATRRP